MHKGKRPKSITVIAWFFIGSSAVSLLFTPLTYVLPGSNIASEAFGISPVISLVWIVAISAVDLASGIAILKRRNWGRVLYLSFGAVSLIVSGVLYGFRLTVPGIAFYGVTLFFLLRPKASAFFKREISERIEAKSLVVRVRKPTSLLRRIASVAVLVISAFFLPALVAMPLLIEQVGFLALIMLIPTAIGGGIMLAGVALWGRERWRVVVGAMLTILGSMLALDAIVLPLIERLPEWQKITETGLSSLMRPLVVGFAGAGVLFLGSGIPLIVSQMRRDKRVRNLDSGDSAPSGVSSTIPDNVKNTGSL